MVEANFLYVFVGIETPATPLFDRLRREGRLLVDSQATNFSPPNFRTVLPLPVLLRGLGDLLLGLYEPAPFFERAFRSLESWRPGPTQRPPEEPLSYRLRAPWQLLAKRIDTIWRPLADARGSEGRRRKSARRLKAGATGPRGR